MLMAFRANDPDIVESVAVRNSYRQQSVEGAAQIDMASAELAMVVHILQTLYLGGIAQLIAVRIASLQRHPADVDLPAKETESAVIRGFREAFHLAPPSLIGATATAMRAVRPEAMMPGTYIAPRQAKRATVATEAVMIDERTSIRARRFDTVALMERMHPLIDTRDAGMVNAFIASVVL